MYRLFFWRWQFGLSYLATTPVILAQAGIQQTIFGGFFRTVPKAGFYCLFVNNNQS